VKCEPVVELGDIDIRWLEISAAPHHLGYLGLGLRIEGIELRPIISIAHRRSYRLDPTAGFFSVRATSIRDITIATAPSHGTSQS